MQQTMVFPGLPLQGENRMQNNILDVKDVTVQFDGFTVLNKMSFSIGYGELRFLIGPNGAGKTTLLDIITSKTKPTTGKVIFDSKVDIHDWQEHKIVQHGIARKFQTPSIFASLSVFENLESAISFRHRSIQLFRRLHNQHVERIHETLELIGLQNKAFVKAGLLSHGEKQWLEIGMLLVQDPKLLLLDEPVAGMTRQERNRTGELLHNIAKDRAVVVVEHDMEFVRAFAKTVTVLHMGQVLCEGPMEQVQNDARVVEVYLGRKQDEVKPRKHERTTAPRKIGVPVPNLSTSL
jgi:urea transport system ATP-binding protein